jgi:hypothetical protein
VKGVIVKVTLRNAYSYRLEERNDVKEINRIIANDIELVYQDGTTEEIDAARFEINEVR